MPEMLTRVETKGSKLLEGFRGSEPADLEPPAEVIVKIGTIITDMPQVTELEINPLIVHDGGLVAVDARIILSQKFSLANKKNDDTEISTRRRSNSLTLNLLMFRIWFNICHLQERHYATAYKLARKNTVKKNYVAQLTRNLAITLNSPSEWLILMNSRNNSQNLKSPI